MKKKKTRRNGGGRALSTLAPPVVVADPSGVYVRVPPELVDVVLELVRSRVVPVAAEVQRVARANPEASALVLRALEAVLRPPQ